MDKSSILTKLAVVTWSAAIIAMLPLLVSETKVSYDVKQKGESYKNKTPYEAIHNDNVIAKEFTKLFRGAYSNKCYNMAADLMKEGCYDPRPWTQDMDEEYCQNRNEIEPLYGDKAEGWDNIIPINADSGVPGDDIEYVRACIMTMPQGFVKKMAEEGWRVKLSSDNSLTCPLDQAHDNMQTVGQTNWRDKTINLVSSELYGTVYHEFGHVLEDYSKDRLDKAGLLDFNNEELSVLCNHMAFGSLYIYLNPEEQLAESFYDYLFYPRETKASAPVLYGIYDDTIASFG